MALQRYEPQLDTYPGPTFAFVGVFIQETENGKFLGYYEVEEKVRSWCLVHDPEGLKGLYHKLFGSNND